MQPSAVSLSESSIKLLLLLLLLHFCTAEKMMNVDRNDN